MRSQMHQHAKPASRRAPARPRGFTPAHPDRDLVAALRARDPHAIERVVEVYGRLIASWASSAEDTEDVVQDVLLQLWRNADRLAPDTTLAAWLKTVTTNTMRNRWRTRSRKPSVPAGLHLEQTATEGGPETLLENAGIREILSGLTRREREILLLLYVRDLPMDEAAERLDLSVSAAKSLAARARRRVRDILAAERRPAKAA